MSRLKGVRQNLRVTLPDKTIDVATKPFDYDLYGLTAKKHGWPEASENPVGYLLFLSWSAARRTGQIGTDVPFERFKELVDDLEELEPETVDPTVPAPGAGSSVKSP
jgi:hypothetical protein